MGRGGRSGLKAPGPGTPLSSGARSRWPILNEAARAILLVAPDTLTDEYSPGPGSSGSAGRQEGWLRGQVEWRQRQAAAGGDGGGKAGGVGGSRRALE